MKQKSLLYLLPVSSLYIESVSIFPSDILVCNDPIYITHKEYEPTIVMHIAQAAFKAITLLLLRTAY